ncbi:hypothetical protein R1T08_02145 [Streptomyces sp. SBC-4]|nr:hypothetical protein [Streptomyces sp. SBC-4]MDV5143145.1 hypothetical protein [Streptomyces sp. SBC-4]
MSRSTSRSPCAPPTPDVLVARVQSSLKAGPVAVRAAVGELLSEQLLAADGGRLRRMDTEGELLAAAGARSAPISARVLGGIPAGDVAAVGRVIALVTERADARRAGLPA